VYKYKVDNMYNLFDSHGKKIAEADNKDEAERIIFAMNQTYNSKESDYEIGRE